VYRFVGVARHKQQFQARLRLEKKTIFLGGYASEEEAAMAYDKALIYKV